jgi:dipeptidyl aminopeptidase/acylaminoacyl peptidase
MNRNDAWSCVFALLFANATLAADKHPFGLQDLHRVRDVSEPALSPDGQWLAYTVSRHNLELDKTVSDVWRVSYDGKLGNQMTSGDEFSNDSPKWSPDGKWLAFLSDRGGDDTAQVWAMPASGGEAKQLTEFKSGVSDFVWSPDSRQLALIARDDSDPAAVAVSRHQDPSGKPESSNEHSKDTANPIVLDRFQFKDDDNGYLDHHRSHLYVFELASRHATLLTPGDHDEWLPAWSPDGRHIVYASKRGADPDRTLNSDLYLIEPHAGSTERQLTTFPGADEDPYWESRPSWSPDSRQVAYLQSGEDRWIYYAPWQLAVVDVASGKARIPAPIDRCFTIPKWSADGKSVYALIEENRNTYVSRIALDSGKVDRLTSGSRFDVDFVVGRNRIAVLTGDDTHPPELFSLAGTALRQLSHQNDPLLADVQLQPTEDISFRSKDGTRIDGLLMKPVGYQPGKKYPTVLSIHGGPVYQYSHEFLDYWQWFAAHGYAVVAPNPRGSSGRGFAFAKAIYADWGNLDAQDVLAAVDHVVQMGIADPDRLAIGGRSYGGILTNYVIAKDPRFKAAFSEAGSANVLTMYGLDEYTPVYELELGKPWEHPDAYLRLSFPFLHADRIKTPTLFTCFDKDFNVPCEGAEQMYQALRSLDIPTELVIYPDQHHQPDVPSYLGDRLQRRIDWFAKYLK